MKTYSLSHNHCDLQVYANIHNGTDSILLILHGGPGSGAKPLLDHEAFQTLNTKVSTVYFDQRGCGKSKYDLRKGLTIKDLTDDVLQVVAFIKKTWAIKNLFLMGGSFGGYLACLCMERFPNAFSGLLLTSPAITFSREQALIFYENSTKRYTPRFSTTLFMNLEDSPEKFFSNPRNQEFIFSKDNPAMSLKYACAMSPWFFKQDFTSLLQTLEIPTLILQGLDDTICLPYRIHDAILQAQNPHIKYLEYSNCGHAIFEDQTKEFVNEIYNFVKENSTC